MGEYFCILPPFGSYCTVYKRPREGAEKGVNLLSVRYGTVGLCIGSKRGAAFSEAFSHSKLLSTKNETRKSRST